MSDSVYFASDAHFGAGSAESQRQRRALFLRWLDSLEDNAQLYLLGDIFDFWLDYPTYMPKTHLEILYGLKKAQDRGVHLSFVGGNHDIWCADFLGDSLDVNILEDGTVVEHQGVRLRLHHGDGLLAGDQLYKAFRWMVRNPVLVFLAKSLHPEILHRLADAISRASRDSHDSDETERIRQSVRSYGLQHSHSDVDHLIMGHIHTPLTEEFDGWSLSCLGDWVANYTAGVLRDGKLRIIDVRAEVDSVDTAALSSRGKAE